MKLEELAKLMKMSLEDTRKMLDEQDTICLNLKENLKQQDKDNLKIQEM